MVGAASDPGRLRLYLAGPLSVEWGGRVLGERDLPSRQARLLLAYLVCERARPAARDAVAELLWPRETPPSWGSSLKALASKLRALLRGLAPPGAPQPEIRAQYGCYQLELPGEAWVDVEAARAACDAGEGALRRGDLDASWSSFNVTVAIGRRGFLPGESAAWAEERRRELQRLLVRGLDGYAEVSLSIGQPALAVEAAHEATTLDPLREASWRLLLRGHEAAGNRPGALAAFHELRTLLREELGVSPSDETASLFARILKGEPPSPRSPQPPPARGSGRSR